MAIASASQMESDRFDPPVFGGDTNISYYGLWTDSPKKILN